MRLAIASLIFWFFLFYNVERLSRIINITDIAYIFVPLVIILIVLLRQSRQLSLGLLLGGPVTVFVILKTLFKSGVWTDTLLLTITEISFLIVSIILARWVALGIGEFEDAIAHITIGQAQVSIPSFATGQAEMYRELKRARHHQRPLALVAVSVDKQSIDVAVDRMVRDTQLVMMRQYVLSDVGRKLCDMLDDYNIIAHNNDRFFILLPEMPAAHLEGLTQRLYDVVVEEMGVRLQIGAAAFPGDAMTFDALVKKATKDMKYPDADNQLRHSLPSSTLVSDHQGM
ncbi:MAG: hypothetical protein JXA33_07490 [Anaerolineae bacterium]|nr:hypothetical protein [Anaerolineae bacterium]